MSSYEEDMAGYEYEADMDAKAEYESQLDAQEFAEMQQQDVLAKMTPQEEFLGHLEFKELPPNPKTKRFSVVSRHDGAELGIIEWNPRWRQYWIVVNEKCGWSWDCLLAASDFIRSLMDERKAVR